MTPVLSVYDLTSQQSTERWRLIMQERDLGARRAGQMAFDAKQSRDSNPHAFLTAAWANWDYGWDAECEAAS